MSFSGQTAFVTVIIQFVSTHLLMVMTKLMFELGSISTTTAYLMKMKLVSLQK